MVSGMEDVPFGPDQQGVDLVLGALARYRRVGVAYSGGVDSATLLALAVRALGAHHVVAILGVSPSLAGDERTAAHDVAAFIGVPVVEVRTHEGDNPAYQRNGPDRCFHCKDELFTRITDTVIANHALDADPCHRVPGIGRGRSRGVLPRSHPAAPVSGGRPVGVDTC